MNLNQNKPRLPVDAHNKFDHVLNGIVASAFFKISGLPPASFVKIDTAFRTTQEVRVDLLIHVKHAKRSDNYLAHIEIQTQSDKKMFIRLFKYLALIYEEKKMDVVQYVIYVGARPPKMRTELDMRDHLRYKFHLIYLKEINGAPFLGSSIPEEVMLALLCKFPEGQKAPAYIERIVQKIAALKAGEPETLKKYFLQLTIISQLRNLQQETRTQIKKVMPQSFYSIKKDPFYQEVKAEGIAEGIEKGIEKTQRANIERLLLKKLLSEIEIADALEVPLALVRSIRGNLVASGRLAD